MDSSVPLDLGSETYRLAQASHGFTAFQTLLMNHAPQGASNFAPRGSAQQAARFVGCSKTKNLLKQMIDMTDMKDMKAMKDMVGAVGVQQLQFPPILCWDL